MRLTLSRSPWNIPPPILLALVYLGLIVLGTGLLWLPIAHGGGVALGDAAFTATSAITVTGLTVVETGQDYTLFGQVVIAMLIQIGGLGIMTVAALVLSAIGVPISLPQQMVLRADLNQTSIRNLALLARRVLQVALLCEAVGAAILASVFVPEFGWGGGLWQAVFHAVSAFNNAGFSLFETSMRDYAGDPRIGLTLIALFVTGGLGFVVIGELLQFRRWTLLSLHAKLMLWGTVALAALGWVGFAVLEWVNPDTLGELPLWAKLQVSLFQGLTPRTAGFNTVDVSQINDATALFTMGLMFVGGGSASTAGGIKVTSFIVAILATIAFFRQTRQVHAHNRAIGIESIMKVMALVTVSLFVIFMTTFALAIESEDDFLPLAFEAVSAFGTVGLSMGATEQLDTFGRLVLCATMFLGRVGPLTLGFVLARRAGRRVQYPEGRIYLG